MRRRAVKDVCTIIGASDVTYISFSLKKATARKKDFEEEGDESVEQEPWKQLK